MKISDKNITYIIQFLVIIAAVLVVLSSLSVTEEEDPEETAVVVPLPPNMYSSSQHVIGTGNKLGTYYPAGVILAEWFNSHLEANGGSFKAFETNGSVDNIQLLKTKRIQLGMIESRVAKESFEKEASSSLRLVWPLWFDVVQIIKPPADLYPGYRFPNDDNGFVGQHKSSTERTSYEILTALGDKRKHNADIQMENVINAIADAKISFAMIQAGIPNKNVAEAIAFRHCGLVSFTLEQLEKIQKNVSTSVPFTIESNYYSNGQEECHTIGLPNVLVATTDASPEQIEFVIDMLVKGCPKLQGRFKTFATVPNDAETVMKVLSETGVPLHEGTKRWLEKNIDKSEAGEAK
mgnify:CR=1 FL=1